MQKKQQERTFLILITAVLIVGALILIFYTVKNRQTKDVCEINGEQIPINGVISLEGQDCECRESGLVCKEKEEKQILMIDPIAPNKFKLKGFGFTYASTTLVKQDEDSNLSPVEFETVSYDNKTLTVVVNEIQKCSSDEKALKQVGLFYSDDSNIVLSSMMNVADAVEDESIECIVKMSFKIKDLKLNKDSTPKIFFQRDNILTLAPVCFYDRKFYLQDDVFTADNGCLTCSCNMSRVSCEYNSTCKTDDSKSVSVYENYPNRSRYEDPEKAGECQQPSDCIISGCNGEVCAAKNVTTTCEAISKIEDAKCKCVDTKCLWTK